MPGSAVVSARAGLIEERLYAIVVALDGRDLGTNAEELWFRYESDDSLEIRLGRSCDGPCYQRSANFAISYTGKPSEAAAAASLPGAIDRIRALDATPLDDVEGCFGIAAANVVRRFTAGLEFGPESGSEPDVVDRAIALGSPAVAVGAAASASPDEVAEPDPRWERVQTRKLNVVFLDLCADLISGQTRSLSPLHWGFWPAGAPSALPSDAGRDPFWAFSENLLSYIPSEVGRVMDVGCGLGANTKLLAGRNMRVTAVSPVQHHCDLIEAAGLPGVEVRCARFEEMDAADPYDLLLFSESMNHFPLTEEFFEHCKLFLRRSGYMLMADDLVEERARWIEEQQIFRVLRAVDISENVAPTSAWWAGQKRALAAYGNALMAVLEMHDAEIAERVRGILGDLDSDELRMLLSDGSASPASKGRYMIYLLRRD